MAESPQRASLATKTFLAQSQVSKRIKLHENPLNAPNRPDEEEFNQNINPASFSPSQDPDPNPGLSDKRPRHPRLSSHGITSDLLLLLREKAPAEAYDAVEPAQVHPSQEGPPVEWQLLPCLKEVIPSELRESLSVATADGKPLIQSDSLPKVGAFPKVRRSSARFSSGAAGTTRSNYARFGPGHETANGTSPRGGSGKIELQKRFAINSQLSWKSRRGKFAANTSSQSNKTDYPWMPFLSILHGV